MNENDRALAAARRPRSNIHSSPRRPGQCAWAVVASAAMHGLGDAGCSSFDKAFGPHRSSSTPELGIRLWVTSTGPIVADAQDFSARPHLAVRHVVEHIGFELPRRPN